MTTKKARNFLDKELFVNRSIVTFRSLSRELGIHVNDAKNELQRYYDGVRDTDAAAVPTYLVSGEVPALPPSTHHPDTQQSDSAMDVDLEFEEDRVEEAVGEDVVHQSRMLLVDACALEETMAQFARVYSVHIYSLSPSRLGDAGLVCLPSSKVRQVDAKGGPESFSVVGKITGPHVKLKAGDSYTYTASSSKMTSDVPLKPTLKAVSHVKTEEQTNKGESLFTATREQTSKTTALTKTESKDRPKLPGKLDWSKAKTRERGPVTEKGHKKPEPELKSTVIAGDSSSRQKLKPGSTKQSLAKSGSSTITSGGAQKRGIKRKPNMDTDLDSESEPSATKAEPIATGISASRKGVVYSDEDESEGPVRRLGQRRQQRKNTMTSDSEMSLRAMMDIDDEQVDRVTRMGKVHPEPEEEEESSGLENEASAPPATSEGEESDDVVVPPKKRKPRKAIPVGRNGLRKRRVVKSRTTTDAKGYMQTDDYSSYESVEEEEVETKPKGKKKETKKETKKASEPKIEEVERKVVAREESSGKSKAKPTPKPRGGAPKRGGLLNFFGPEKGKK